MKVLLAQLNPTIGALAGNTKKILDTLDRAREKKADLVLFPELAICGYPPEDLVLHSSFIDTMENCLEQIIHASSGIIALVGLVRRNLQAGGKSLLNSVAIIQDRKLIGFQDKSLLPTYDVFDERRYFEPGKSVYPWLLKGKNVGIIICEDIWQHSGYTGGTRYAMDPILELRNHKIDVLLNLSASPYQFQKPNVRVNVCCKAAKTLHCPVLLCCQVGANDQLVFDGYSVYVNEKGELCRLGKGFEEEDILVDLDRPSVPCTFHYDPLSDLYHALVIGVRDYFHKSGFSKACLGLSGGIDSALVACIAAEALGRENVLCVNMPSCYSSKEAIEDAIQLAKRLGVTFKQIPIEKPFEDYLKLLEPFLEGKPPDITEENLQSRIRGMILMALSNKLGHVVISTGNKSEMAMGYCTLYGDLAGGLAAIADVTKTQVYELARWINREKEIIPKRIIERAPSAELRPNQKDSDSLPSYDIVDAVLQAYVEDFLSPSEISQKYQIPLEMVEDLVQRIHRAEYKRRQAPPGIRVSKKAFRVGRRYPIVQGWV